MARVSDRTSFVTLHALLVLAFASRGLALPLPLGQTGESEQHVCLTEADCKTPQSEAATASSLLQAGSNIRKSSDASEAALIPGQQSVQQMRLYAERHQLDFCDAAIGKAVPMCNSEQHSDERTLLHSANQETALSGNWQAGVVSSISWLHVSSEGDQCMVKPGQSSSASKLVFDESDLGPVEEKLTACPSWMGDGSATTSMNNFFLKLKAKGMVSFESYPIQYKYKNRMHQGSMRFLWFIPPECPAAGCQVVVYLHGLNKVSQLGTWLPDPLNGVERLGQRASCPEEYAQLRSIIAMPILEPAAFPDAAPELITAHNTEAFANFGLRAKTRFSWHTPDIDVFGDAVMPILKKLMQQHAAHVDANRVQLVGFSMGGVGAMVGAFSYMDVFSSVIGISACVNAESHFPGPSIAYMPERPMAPGLKKLERIVLFIGEDDGMYEGDAASCVDVWSQMLGVAESRGLINSTGRDHVEIRLLRDGSPQEESPREHCSAFKYAIAELDSLLWRDSGC